MNGKFQKKKIPVKSIFHHVTRAKLYAILTMNALEGMMLEMSHVLDPEYERVNFDIFAEGYRRYQNGVVFPTSHGDYLDRAVKSLAKELELPISIEPENSQAVKKVIMSITRGANEQEKSEILEWLNENNDFIVKSPRYDQLIDNACLFFYKRPSSQVSEDTLAFIRRSANELLRNKASKEAMKKRLYSVDAEEGVMVDKVLRSSDVFQREFDAMNDDDMSDSDDGSDNDLILGDKMKTSLLNKRDQMNNGNGMMAYDDKRLKGDISL